MTEPGFALSVGENLSNQLGLTLDVDGRKKPQLIKMCPCQGEVIQVASGGMHSATLSSDGSVYTFGCNDEFALGREDDEDIDKVELPEKMIEITAGDSHTAALSETGIVYAWGTFRVIFIFILFMAGFLMRSSEIVNYPLSYCIHNFLQVIGVQSFLGFT